MVRIGEWRKTLFDVVHIVNNDDQGAYSDSYEILVLLVDAAQVVRVLLQPVYGWTSSSYSVTRFVDVVFLMEWLCSKIISRLFFFVFAVALVFAMLVSFRLVAGMVSCSPHGVSLPIHFRESFLCIRILRGLVQVAVRMLFNSLVAWLLIPCDCHFEHESLSSIIHGSSAKCSPWQVPEIFISVPALLLMASYMTMTLVLSYLLFVPDPLSRSPLAQSSGRVELLYAGTKAAAVLLAFLVPFISQVVAALVLLILSAGSCYRHLLCLPFYKQRCNVVRGAIHASLTWTAFSTLLVCIVNTTAVAGSAGAQVNQCLQTRRYNKAVCLLSVMVLVST